MNGAIDILEAGVVLLDEDGVVRAWSRGMAAQFGVPRERALGVPWREVLQTQLAPLLVIAAEDLARLAGPASAAGERVSARRVGDRAEGVSLTRTALASGGSVVELTAAVHARQRELMLEAVYDAMPDMVFVHGPGGRVVDVNASTCRVLGGTKAEFAAADPPRLMGASMSVDDAFARLSRAAAGEDQDFEWITRTFEGREFPVEVRLRRVSTLEGPGEYHVLAISRDITERKRAEEALRGSEERYRAMFERNQAMKWIIDPTDGRIVDVNEAAAAFYGYSKEELLQMRVTDLNIAPPEEVAAHMRRARAEERVSFRFQHRKRSGEVADVEVQSGPIQLDDRVVLFSVIHDVSERRRLEDRLRVAHHMEALGRLAGGVAHDFNNLMTVVIGASALVVEQLPEGSALRPQVREIEEAGRRAARLTQQLLAVGSRQVLSLCTVDLNAALLRSQGMLGHVLPPSVVLVHELSEEAPFVSVDPDQLDQVLLNLVINARDAMPEGGRLVLRTARLELEGPAGELAELPAGRYVLFEVQDTGVGIAPAELSLVFEPFYTTKGGERGTGLGLATVYGIVKQSGGHISVKSTLGAGTTFRIVLPAAGTAQAPALHEGGERAKALVPRGSETILLVDDDDLVRKVVALMLKGQGYRVLTASDGEEALRLSSAHAGPIDLLLTDVLMPRMGGDALALELRAARPRMSVLFMSGSTNNTVLPSQALGGRVGFLQKPLTPGELAAALRALLLSEDDA